MLLDLLIHMSLVVIRCTCLLIITSVCCLFVCQSASLLLFILCISKVVEHRIGELISEIEFHVIVCVKWQNR